MKSTNIKETVLWISLLCCVVLIFAACFPSSAATIEAFIWMHFIHIHTWGLTNTTSVCCDTPPHTHTHGLLEVCFRVLGLWSVWIRTQWWTGWASGCKQDYWISGRSPDVAALLVQIRLLPGAFPREGHVLCVAVSCVLPSLEFISSVSSSTPLPLCLHPVHSPCQGDSFSTGTQMQTVFYINCLCRWMCSHIRQCFQTVWSWSLGSMWTVHASLHGWADYYVYPTKVNALT